MHRVAAGVEDGKECARVMENSATVMSEIEMSLVSENGIQDARRRGIPDLRSQTGTLLNCENTGITHLVHIELALPSS